MVPGVEVASGSRRDGGRGSVALLGDQATGREGPNPKRAPAWRRRLGPMKKLLILIALIALGAVAAKKIKAV